MRSAVIDLGSCTFHALVADVDELGIRNVVFERKIALRLGEHPGHIPDALYRRAIDALDDLLVRTWPRVADRCRVIATNSFRDADNGEALLAEACTRHDVTPEILDDDAHARLTWLGVSTELAGSHGGLAVVDLGGGSLRCVAGTDGVECVRGMPLGVLRLRGMSAAAIQDAVGSQMTLADIRACRLETIAIASGTARALLGFGRKLGLVAPHQRHVGARTFGELARRLSPLSPEQIASLGVPAGRADTIAGGAVALATVLERLGRPVVYVARSGLREGALVDVARRGRWAPASTPVRVVAQRL